MSDENKPGECPCVRLKLEQAPHEDRSLCVAALASTIYGYQDRTVVSTMRTIRQELWIARGDRDDVLKLKGTDRWEHHTNVALAELDRLAVMLGLRT